MPHVDINKIHREYWETRQVKINDLLTKPHLVAIVARREADKSRFVKMAVSESARIERIRNQRCFESELEAAADEFSSLPVIEAQPLPIIESQPLPIIKAQRIRAKKPRGKVTDDGKTLNQVIETLASKAEHRCLTAPALWPHFFAALDQLGLDPEELSQSNTRKLAYSYDFKDKRKTIGYRRFATFVSDCRKKSR
jgi:hypothetical protein